MHDLDQLERFISAQQPVLETVLAELRAGEKRSHWMWFIFPQIKGLGHSDMARRFALSSLDEARAYLAHPLLGPRLRLCCRLVADIDGRSVDRIFGYPDNLKLHSCLTLFSQAGQDNAVFRECLEKYFAGKPDAATLVQLGAKPT